MTKKHKGAHLNTKHNKDIRIATRIDSELAKTFQMIVDHFELTKAQVIRKLIKEYVKKHKQEVEMDKNS